MRATLSGLNLAMGGVVGIACGLVGCGGSTAGGGFSPGPMPQGGEWGGVYYSNWGRMELERTGNHVTGEYEGDVKRGRVEGTINGNAVRFHWTQEDNTIPGHPRSVSGHGVFHYVIDANGEHKLEGIWGYGEEVSGGGNWNASRSRARRQRPSQTESTETQGTGSEAPAQGATPPAGGAGQTPDLTGL